MLIRTFLEKHNLKGKTVIPFCTSAGSGISGSMSSIRESASGANVKAGRDLTDDSQAQVKRWLDSVMAGKSNNSNSDANTSNNTNDNNNNTNTDNNVNGSNNDANADNNVNDSNNNASVDNNVNDNNNDANVDNNTNILIAYFSWSGTSQRQAEYIASQTGGILYRIEREVPYSDDYNTVAYGEAKDEADANARPVIKNPLSSIDNYDKVVLCYPIWWHTAPMTVGTFLEAFDWSGKTIYPVSQSASMDTSQYEESVAFIKACAKNAVVDAGIFTKSNTEIADYINNTVLK